MIRQEGSHGSEPASITARASATADERSETWRQRESSCGSTTRDLLPRAVLAENFKIPTLWGVRDTAPYFHDNGAKTIRDAVAHYKRFFNFTEEQDPVGSASLGGRITLTDDDVDDIVAYLQLLGPNRMDR